MKILLCFLILVLAIASISFQAFFLMKKKEFKVVMTQLGIISIAIIGGIILIYKPYSFSLAGMLIRIIPWMN